MTKRTVKLLVLPFMLLLLIALAGATQFPSFAEEPSEGSPALRDLDRLRAMYAAPRSIHLRAKFSIATADSVGSLVEGEGVYEFWWEGGAYRIRSQADPALGLAADFEFAFDGETYAFLYPEISLLSLSSEPPVDRPTSLPNPLLIPFMLIAEGAPGCTECKLRFEDLGDEEFWASRRAVTEKLESRVPGAEEFRIGSRSYRWSPNAGSLFPAQIAMSESGPGGVHSAEASFIMAKAELPTSTLVPGEIHFRVREPGGGLDANIIIEQVSFDTPIDPTRFTIDDRLADRIWDSDNRFFLRHPQLHLVNSMIE